MTVTEKPITKIKVRISSVNGAQWGEDTKDEAVEILAPNLLALARAYLRSKYSNVQIDADLTREFTEGIVSGSPYNVISDLAVYIYQNWSKPPVWEPDFDAATFLKENPPHG